MTDDTVAESHANEMEAWREYQRNRRDDDGFDAEARASYDMPVEEMSDAQIIKQHEELLEMQEDADYNNNMAVAKEIAQRRQKLFEESRCRGISDQLTQ
jgi:hypothetical protein